MSASAADIASNLREVRARIARAAAASGRKPQDVTLIGVSKTQSAEAIRVAYETGLRDFGENRVQEWEGKQRQLADLDARWHLVGHLQSNKAARASKLFHYIDSVDSLDLAEKLNRCGSALAPTPILLEVKLDPTPAKSGLTPEQLSVVAESIVALPNLKLRGLMCVPPFAENPEQARPFFRQLRELRDALAQQLGIALPALSMGMSHDFEVAIQEGATEIRVGTAIFGQRIRT